MKVSLWTLSECLTAWCSGSVFNVSTVNTWPRCAVKLEVSLMWTQWIHDHVVQWNWKCRCEHWVNAWPRCAVELEVSYLHFTVNTESIECTGFCLQWKCCRITVILLTTCLGSSWNCLALVRWYNLSFWKLSSVNLISQCLSHGVFRCGTHTFLGIRKVLPQYLSWSCRLWPCWQIDFYYINYYELAIHE